LANFNFSRIDTFEDFVDWSTFSIKIHINEIQNIPSILNSYTTEQKVDLIKAGYKVYKDFFTLEKTCNYILEILKQKNGS
jgi:hypothetical protein